MSRPSRLAAVLVLAPALAARAAPPPITPVAEPPARVGRLAALTGAVSFHTAEQAAWSPALANLPVTSGDAIWTEPDARAALDIAGNRIWLDARTLLELPALDDHAVSANEPQGTLFIHLRVVPPGDAYAVQTPRGLVQLLASGRYEIIAGDEGQPTRVTVLDGAAQVSAPGLTLDVGANTAATLTGAGTDPDPVRGTLGPARRDAFLEQVLGAERPALSHPVVARMTGAEDLDRYGAWQDRPKYGAVWYPQVDPGWVPYRHGRWSWVAPWGWTWVDEAPWGFAPFHYGRWVQDGGRWGWAPAPAPEYVAQPAYVVEPVYAPALVSFVALGAVVAGLGERPAGWVPLGPNEPYYPPYRAGLPYIQNLNRGTVQNARTVINDNSVHTSTYNRTVVQNFINHGGVTVVPASAVVSSRPVAAAVLPQAVAAPVLARAQAGFRPAFLPTAATLGATALVARQFHFAPPVPPTAAGPAITLRTVPPVPLPAAAPGGTPPAPVSGAAPRGVPAVASPSLPPGTGPNAPAPPARGQPSPEPATPARPPLTPAAPAMQPAEAARQPPPAPVQPLLANPRTERPGIPQPPVTQRDMASPPRTGAGQPSASRPSERPRPAEPAQAAPPPAPRPAAPPRPATVPAAFPAQPRTPVPAPRPAPPPRPRPAPPPATRLEQRPAAPPPRPAPPRAAAPRPAPHPSSGGQHDPHRH